MQAPLVTYIDKFLSFHMTHILCTLVEQYVIRKFKKSSSDTIATLLKGVKFDSTIVQVTFLPRPIAESAKLIVKQEIAQVDR